MMYIMPYKIGSKSAKLLATELGCLQIKGDKRLSNNSVVINWGNKHTQPITNRRMPAKIFNSPAAVIKAADKLLTFTALSRYGVRIPECTVTSSVAKQWVEDGSLVYGRRYTDSSQGKGIEILTQDDMFISHLPLYTKGIVGGEEYRVHVAFGKVIDYTKKLKRRGTNPNEYVRNHENGWVFCREGVILPPDAAVQSIKAIDALGLDFGALDVIVKDSVAYVLEVNSAPGIEQTTVLKYKQAFLGELT